MNHNEKTATTNAAIVQSPSPGRRKRGMFLSFFLGAVCAEAGIFPVASLLALVFRFPVPFVGYESGLRGAVDAPFAVVFYGLVCGGFVILLVLGGIAGVVVHVVGARKNKPVMRLVVASALAVDLVATMVMACLDLLIGPW